jgi:putative oxidoreductase
MKIQQTQWGIALLRIVTGSIFFVHGWQKLFTFGYEGTSGAFTQMGVPIPAVAAAVVIAVELLGGLALMLGFLTRLAALPLAIDMLAARFLVHLGSGFFVQNNGYELVLILAAASLSLALLGAGAFALDNLGAVRRVTPRSLRA